MSTREQQFEGINGETDPLLSSSKQDEAGTDPDTDDRMAQDPSIILPRRKWIVEPIVLLFCIALFCQSAVLSQYVYFKVGKQYNGTQNDTRAFVCDSSSQANSTQHTLTNQIQNEASSWTLYRSTVSSIISLAVLPIYTSSSDYLGRKPALLLPTIGSALDAIGLLLVVLLDWPLIGLVISGGVGALGGGMGTLFASVFTYLADTTTRKGRPVRVFLVEASFGVAALVMELVMGWWIKLMGYSVPLIFSTSVVLIAVLYVIFLVPEVRLRRTRPQLGDKDNTSGGLLSMMLLPVVNIASLFAISKRLSITLALLLASMLVFFSSFLGSSTVTSLYQMNYPFCLDSVFIGYLGAAKVVCFQIGAVIGLVVLRKYLGVKTIALIVIGLLSSAVGSLITGLAQNTAMLFVASATSMFAMLAIPMYRAYTSQISPPERQGALFSCIGVLEVAGSLAGSTGFTLLYKSTLEWMPGFVYLVVSGTTAVAILLTAICLLIDTCWPQVTGGGSNTMEVASESHAGDNDSSGIVNH